MSLKTQQTKIFQSFERILIQWLHLDAHDDYNLRVSEIM